VAAAAVVIAVLLFGTLRGEGTDRIITDDPTLPPTTQALPTSTIKLSVVPTAGWSRIDTIPASTGNYVQVISDGQSFTALVEVTPGEREFLRSDDGLRWVSTDPLPDSQFEIRQPNFNRSLTPTAIEGGFVRDFGREIAGSVTEFSVDGVSWSPVTDTETGDPLPTGGTVRVSPNRAIYVVNDTSGPLYEITNQGAVLINPTPSAPDERPRGRDGDDRTLTFGDAGAAYVTRFLGSNVEGPEAPSELVFSTDGHTWTRTNLPEEMIVGRVRLTVGSEGVVATVQDFENNSVTIWYRSIVEQ
jgi:hypothetical protein